MATYDTSQYGFDANGFMRLKKDVEFAMRHLSHNNVKRLYTEYCNIQSENGETVIDGPAIKFYGSDTTLQRMNLGYSSGDFGFWVKDKAGNLTAYLDSTGKLVVTRLISGHVEGSTIIGGTIQGSTIIGGYISGSTINGGYISGSTINGGHIEGSTIVGGSLTVGENFKVKIYENATNGIIRFLDSSDNSAGSISYNELGLTIACASTVSLLLSGYEIYLQSDNAITLTASSQVAVNAPNIQLTATVGKAYYFTGGVNSEIASQNWVSTNYSPIGHTHLYAKTSDISAAISAHVSAYH